MSERRNSDLVAELERNIETGKPKIVPLNDAKNISTK